MTFRLHTILLIICFSLLPSPASSKEVTIGGERPAVLKLPKGYRDHKSYPLVVLLHGRGNTAAITDAYLGLSRSQHKLGYLLLLPDGTVRDDGLQVWNATESCCATNNSDVDDSRYLLDLVHEVKNRYRVDPKKIFIIGHSNGGFMGYRLACDSDGLFAGVASIAGSEFADASACKTETPINVLQIHGTEDDIVPFDAAGKAYPGAFEIIERWADRNQCLSYDESPLRQNLVLLKFEPGLDESGRPTLIGDFKDFVTLSFRPETDEYLYSDCLNESRVGLWKINGSGHAPLFIGKNLVEKVLKFLDSNKK